MGRPFSFWITVAWRPSGAGGGPGAVRGYEFRCGGFAVYCGCVGQFGVGEYVVFRRTIPTERVVLAVMVRPEGGGLGGSVHDRGQEAEAWVRAFLDFGGGAVRQGQGGLARVVFQGFPYCSVREGVYAAEVAVVQVFYLVIGDPAFRAGGGYLVSLFGFGPVCGSAAA